MACSASRCDQALVAQRGAGRQQEVDRHLARFELGELEREVDPLLERLAHAEDPAAAQLHPRVDGQAGGGDAVVVGVGAHDRREQRARRLEVVVVALHPRGREPPGLLLGEEPERARDLESGLGVHRVDRVDHAGEHPLRRPPHRDHDAELGGTRLPGRARRLEHLVELQERVHVDVGRVAGRLRAECAVLRARARLGVDQALELDLGPAVREPDPVRECHEVGQLVEWERGDRERLLARQRSTFVEQRTFGHLQGCGHGAQD